MINANSKNSTNKVCAIVVTHNRLPLLKECISSIKNQNYNCDIFVVNNNSTDDTKAFLVKNKITHLQLSSNIGGAGGFNIGVKKNLHYKYLWLMDDDCIPKPDALEKLMEASAVLDNDFGFLSSKALWIDGSINKMNEARVSSSNCVFDNVYKVDQATFVSFLVKSDTVKCCGLPIKDFFIWGDDIEYSRRISVLNKIKSYYVANSIVIHKTKNNNGSKIAFDSIDNVGRYFYAYRNEFYLFKKEGVFGILYYGFKCLYNFGRIIFLSKDHKAFRLITLFNGIKAGFSFNPEIEFV